MLKQKEAELESAKRREAWMRAALTKASKSGFLWDVDLVLDNETDIPKTEDGEETQNLADLVIALKRDRARIQVISFVVFPIVHVLY
jgi:hypothetical protein